MYLCSLEGVDGSCRGTPVSTEGGTLLRWAYDGSEIFFTEAGRVWSVPISKEPTLTIGTPKIAFDPTPKDLQVGRVDLLPDGRLIAIQSGEDEHEITHVNLILNWDSELSQKVPAR